MWILTAWSFEPWVVAGLGLASIVYAMGIWRLYHEAGPGRVLDRWRIASFAAGMLLLFLALCSPLDEAADQLFSAHMLQHILLMMVVPPLLVWSRPNIAFVWAVSPLWRKRIGRAWSAGGFDRASRVLMHPCVVFVLFCCAFIFWHLPRPYVWGLENEFVHALEHLSFLLTALAFWTIILEPSGHRRLDYGSTLLYLVVTVIVSDMPGALMVLAPGPLYPIHAEGAAAWGMSLMQDQQLAGLIMWIPAGAIYIAAAMWLFVRLLDEPERRALKLHRSMPIAAIILLLPLLLVGCRDGAQSSETRGDPERGAALIGRIGCGTCHIVPGIPGATGLVGPPLDHMGSRIYIAGVLRNTPDNMIAWLRNPQAIVSGNAMPNMGLDRKQAQDIAGYLYTLR
ncbi:MAG TPA: cytochrome c oxidase assembly protein [Methyloceanibacter sp.]|nr:cytochrome c oxidase assembly protein [Methyloceanibacter sp.]